MGSPGSSSSLSATLQRSWRTLACTRASHGGMRMRCCGLPLTRHTHAGQRCTPRCRLLTRMGCPPRSASAATASTARPLPLHPLPLASGPPWIAASRWYLATCSCKQQWWCLLVPVVRSVLTTCLPARCPHQLCRDVCMGTPRSR